MNFINLVSCLGCESPKALFDLLAEHGSDNPSKVFLASAESKRIYAGMSFRAKVACNNALKTLLEKQDLEKLLQRAMKTSGTRTSGLVTLCYVNIRIVGKKSKAITFLHRLVGLDGQTALRDK